MSRDDNLRQLNENEKDENRPVCFGLHAKVRFARLLLCENRIRSDPPPIAETRGLSAGLLVVVPKGPDPGVADLEAASLAADANAGIALDGVAGLCLAEGRAAFGSFCFRCGEPGGQADQFRPAGFPKLKRSGIGVGQPGVVSVVVGQYGTSAVEQLLGSQATGELGAGPGNQRTPKTALVRFQKLDGQCLLGVSKPRSIGLLRRQLPAAIACSIAFWALS